MKPFALAIALLTLGLGTVPQSQPQAPIYDLVLKIRCGK